MAQLTLVDPATTLDTTHLPVIGNKKLTQQEYAIFHDVIVTGVNPIEVCRRYGVLLEDIRKMRKTPWWQELRDDFNEGAQQRLQDHMSASIADACVAYTEILRGQRSSDKSVNAQVKLIENTMKMGKTPILDGDGVRINQSVNAQINITLDMDRIRKEATEEEMYDIHVNGIIPEKYQKVEDP